MENPKGIRVTGKGELKVAPDRISLVFGASTLYPSVGNSIRAAESIMQHIFNVIDQPEARVIKHSTKKYGTSREYARSGKTERLVGYRHEHFVEVILPDHKALQYVLSKAIEETAVKVETVSFYVNDPKPHQREALKLAIEDAREKAQMYADLNKADLGELEAAAEGIEYSYLRVVVEGERMGFSGLRGPSGPTGANGMQFLEAVPNVQEINVSAACTVVYSVQPMVHIED